MELNIVLAHELLLLHLLVLPPVAPVVRVVRGDADVADRGVKPHLEHLVFEPGDWNGRAPLEVTRDAPLFEPYF